MHIPMSSWFTAAMSINSLSATKPPYPTSSSTSITSSTLPGYTPSVFPKVTGLKPYPAQKLSSSSEVTAMTGFKTLIRSTDIASPTPTPTSGSNNLDSRDTDRSNAMDGTPEKQPPTTKTTTITPSATAMADGDTNWEFWCDIYWEPICGDPATHTASPWFHAPTPTMTPAPTPTVVEIVDEGVEGEGEWQ